jgi:hypothetical protein
VKTFPETFPADIKDAQGLMSKAQHTAMLKAAIGANLDARHAHDERRAHKPRKPGDIKLHSMGDLLGVDDNWLSLDSIIADPVHRALQKQMKELGWRLYRVGRQHERDAKGG